MRVRVLDDLANVRAGDKGDTLILAVFARDPSSYDILVEALTSDCVAGHYGHMATGAVRRTLMPTVSSLVFELPGVLGGGVTGSPVLDGHGKTMGYYLLGLPI